MTEFTPLILGLIAMAIIAYSVIDLFQNKNVSKRKRTNLLFMIVIVPLVGSLIYFVIKPNILRTYTRRTSKH
jgi:uncharacterized membrane protein